ncbi:centrosomal protein of 290 kDa isoform X1 [Phyllostomus hastatus]|uniref:centrosomal protein of 290 kDa isoform X1 n=1 Tax=Phyllostomus hastatus TaxID=9423 RepID=UPI001E67E586|nr:centrosomal protein of 290 kDa isoform X1 [Phyllostomus hastatus]XP_045686364.1 centrosomal protein of 290 kDa isoform X1 [Phyllostomus hastatus]XP_045686365.1 centrosomal protein of 290 kDa isoform X1 [Phyllostomus hastatus]XP_045686366.1 centrosomal protein of 290 kDa isoform X1 [Phyllostomus hastatus]XP_045686367.1 centrosomal protein of 290 kDa isoform X1 [Phyllostomus hastatus]
MPPNINWKEIIKVDPDDLPRQEELADNLLFSLSKVEVNELKNESQENVIHLFRITQSLMKMKAQEVELALEEVDKAGEEQAKFENQLKTKVMKLENELEMALQSTGGRDTRFLRDEIRQLEKQLEQKDRELEDMEKELEKEKKVNEQLALRNEEAENENSKLRRENEQLRQDVTDYQKQIDSQKETLLSRRGEDSDYRSQLSKKNYELVQYLDEIQTLTEANEKIEVQNQEMRKNLEESVQEMEKMTDEYNRMKAIVHQTDTLMDQLKKENDHYRLQVKELTDLLRAKNEEDDPIMVAVNAKVEEWKLILSSKDDEIIEYQQMLHNLREKLKNAQLDADKSNVMALQQGIQERDSHIKMLTEQVEQYTKEMEKSTFIIEDLKNELQRNKGASTLSQQTHYMKIQSKVQILEEKTREAERTAELAEADAREKDKELVETLKRLKDYESGVYGLEDAVIEIKNCKNQIKIRDQEIEVLTKEINKLEMKINDFLDENEALRERVGLEPKTMIDLTEFRNRKNLKQQQYRAENQILLKEIESLEEERLDLKKKIRQMAQEKGKRTATSGLKVEDLNLTENFSQASRMGERKFDITGLENISAAHSKIRSSDKIELLHRRASLSIPKAYQKESEEDMTVGSLPRMLSEVHHSVANEVEPFVSLTGHSSSTQVKDNTLPEAITIREIFKAPCLQSLGNLESLVNTFSSESHEEVNELLYSLSDDSMKKVLRIHHAPEKTSFTLKSTSSLRALSTASDLMKKLSLRQKSAIFCPRIHDDKADMDKSQVVTSEDEQVHTHVKYADSSLKEDTRKSEIPLQAEILKSRLEVNLPEPVSITAQSKFSQIDPLENVIEHMWRELVFLRSQSEFLSRELIEKERDLEKSKTIIAKFQKKLKELVEENKQLEEGMKEILQAIQEMQKEPDDKGGETSLIIPSLERLVNAIESKNAEGIFDANLHLKAQVDQLTGRNEELRQELRETRNEVISYSQQLAKANLKIDHLENEISLLRQSEGSNVVFKGIDLPDGIAPSSANIINSLNEYLIHILQELEYKENKLKDLEGSLEDYNRKFAVIRHQQSLLYKEYLSEKETWKTESETMKEEKKKLESQIQQDTIKVKEYNNLLSTLQMDSDEMKKTLSENSRKITVLQVNEKSLVRQYTTLVEMERQLRKENEKQKNDLISMEAEVGEKIGRLQRFKEMAIFKIAALQKVMDNSVSLSELELANKQYNELTVKYRDILQKDNVLVQRTNNLEHLECENASLKEQIESTNKELEITKEKLHTIEQAWEQETKLGNESNMDKAKKSITNTEIASISKKITMLEMKELNERQRAEHSQKMYEHIRTSLKQMEERNFELETKFAELTKINLEAQKVEQILRDELADSVSKTVSDADRQRILELEKNEMELKVEVSKLREISDIAKRQVEILNAQQQSRDKEVESIRMQLLDYQAQSDEKALIAKLHQHIVSLQISEVTALGKLESLTSKLQKMEACNLRLEQKLDEKEQALYYARLEGRNRAKHLRQTIQSLRRQFSGALPLAQQEKFSKTMIQLQNDKLKIMQDMKNSQQEYRNMENKKMELELKLKGLEELISTLKDARGAQKVINWHMKIEALRLQELKLNRELVKDKEEIKYLNNIIFEYEHTISSLEEEIVQQNKFHEERQMAWDQREVELERQLDIFDRQQNEILSAAQKFEEVPGSMPDPSLPLPNQLEIALRKIKENVRIILETRATCKSLEEKLKEKESALQLAEQNILSRDKVINELRLHLPATAEREKLIAELGRKVVEPQSHHTLKIAQQTIANMQARLNQKEEVLKKYQHLLEKAREEQREIVKKHEEDLQILHHKLELQADSSLNKFKQTAWDLLKQPPTPVPTNKHFIRLAEMEQTVAEQDDSLSSLLIKLKKVSQDLERQKEITELKIKEFENTKLRLQENHEDEIKKVKAEIEDLRCLLAQSRNESQSLKSELQAQKEANSRAPTTTMKNLVERLKSQLALKEKQQKALSRALLELRAEMTAAAEERIISATSQKEADLNIQQIVDRHTKELRSQIEDLNENLLKLKEALKTSKNRENSLTDNLSDLTNELQKTQKAYNKMLREKGGLDQENDELKRQIKRLTSGLQGKTLIDNKQSLIEELQKKIKKLESQLERKADEVEMKPVKEKSAREELIRWEEGKKWQSKIEGIRNKLKEKEGEIFILTKQLNTLKDLFAKADKEKLTLQRKLKTTGMTVNQVMGVRALESEKELEELKKRNLDLENDISYIRTHQALPRDSVIEDLRLQNRYLQEKLHALEKQSSKDTYSRVSTSEIESDDHWQREQELQRENLKLSSENIELKFQLEQANKDLPRLKNQVRDLKEMCEFLKKEKAELERKLGHVRGSGRSGKTIPELEKTIGLMKKVVEKVQRENEQLKKASGILTSEKMANLELENEKLKAELEKLKVHLGRQLSMHYESKTKGTEKIVAENERLRKELKKETEAAEKLRIAKNNLEILNEKMTVQLEETGKRLQLAESRGPQLEGADSKSWKSIVVTRMYETKLKELETDIAKKTQSLTDLKQLVRQATEREQKIKKYTEGLEQQIEILKHVPEGVETEPGLQRELQVLRLANNQLEKEKAELIHQIETQKDQSGAESTMHDPDQLQEKLKDLETQLKTSDLEKQHLKEEIKKLKKELQNFDPSFFEEIEDLKYNYKEEVKKNILLEEKLKKLSEQSGIQLTSPTAASEQLEDEEEESPVNFPLY